MVLPLDAKEGGEKKKCILPGNAQTEQPKLHFVDNICITPLSQELSIRKNVSLCYSDCDNPRPLWRLLCHNSQQLLYSIRFVGPQTKSWWKQPNCVSADDSLGLMMSESHWPPLSCFAFLQEAYQISCAKMCLSALRNVLFHYKHWVRLIMYHCVSITVHVEGRLRQEVTSSISNLEI